MSTILVIVLLSSDVANNTFFCRNSFRKAVVAPCMGAPRHPLELWKHISIHKRDQYAVKLSDGYLTIIIETKRNVHLKIGIILGFSILMVKIILTIIIIIEVIMQNL